MNYWNWRIYKHQQGSLVWKANKISWIRFCWICNPKTINKVSFEVSE